jgi:hypothetical protein
VGRLQGLTNVLCPIDGCDFVLEVPEKGGAMAYMASYKKLEEHVIKRHVISHLIEILWHRVLREAKVKF